MLIKCSGIALPWFQSAETFQRERFTRLAFRDFLRAPEASSVPVLFDHSATMPVPIAGDVEWSHSDAGLAVAFNIDASNQFGRQIALAVRHGHLRFLSVQTRILASEKRIETSGRHYQRVNAAEVLELSFVPEAAFRGTSVRIAGQPFPTVRSYPTDASEKAALRSFLTRAGLDSPSFLPSVESRLFKQATRPVTNATTKPVPNPVDSPAAILKRYAGQEICIWDKPPGGGGKTFHELMTPEQQLEALDQILGIEPRPKSKSGTNRK